MLKACRGYDAWKAQQKKPNWKPWLFPEQLMDSIPRIDMSDIMSMDEVQQTELIDETAAREESGARDGEDGEDQVDNAAGMIHEGCVCTVFSPALIQAMSVVKVLQVFVIVDIPALPYAFVFSWLMS